MDHEDPWRQSRAAFMLLTAPIDERSRLQNKFDSKKNFFFFAVCLVFTKNKKKTLVMSHILSKKERSLLCAQLVHIGHAKREHIFASMTLCLSTFDVFTGWLGLATMSRVSHYWCATQAAWLLCQSTSTSPTAFGVQANKTHVPKLRWRSCVHALRAQLLQFVNFRL